MAKTSERTILLAGQGAVKLTGNAHPGLIALPYMYWICTGKRASGKLWDEHMGKTVGGVEAWAVILRRKQNRRLFREICQVGCAGVASYWLTYPIHNYCNTIIGILSRTFLIAVV